MKAPADLGYRWPAEWEPHRATWLSWPHNRETWPESLPAVTESFAAMVRALVPHEAVCIGVGDEAIESRARAALARAGVDPEGVTFHRYATNDAWARDHGPIFVVRREPQAPEGRTQRAAGDQGPSGRARLAVLDFRFDNWGRKYPGWEADDSVPGHVAHILSLPRFACETVLEGGAIDGDGLGSVLTTESCLQNPNRGPGRTRERMEQVLADSLGATRVLWLAGGIEGDDTDGHVDDVARFVAPGVVVAAVCADRADANWVPLAENRRRLGAMTDARGAALSVVELPMPPRLSAGALRSPASYANFYLANGVALVPTFGVPSDARALSILRELLAGREIVGIPSAELVSGLGAVHCVTQQEPAV
jgi:agmatine deiminase